MRMLIVLCTAAVLFGIIDASAQNAPPTDCDRLLGSPTDLGRIDSGILADKIDTDAAIPACESAVRQYSNDVRLIFQLGRAYDEAKRFQAAVDHYRKAAERGYAPAQKPFIRRSSGIPGRG